MNTNTQLIGRIVSILALIALTALFPPGPTRAQGEPNDAQPVPAQATPGAQRLYLPLLANGAAQTAPDLIFEPNSVALQPGQSARVQVRVEPAADLAGASFELPGAQNGVTSEFVAAPDGQSGTLTIAASTASDAGDQAIIVQGTSGDGSKG